MRLVSIKKQILGLFPFLALCFGLGVSDLWAQGRNSISLKFMGLSFHPLSGKDNAPLMPHRLDPRGYLVLDLGGMFSYERFLYRDVLSLKFAQGLYADCAAQLAGFTHLGLRGRIFSFKRHSLYGGIGPTLIYRHSWAKLPGYSDTGYYRKDPSGTWEYRFLWYGGEFEYKYGLSARMDASVTFVPGYPDLIALAVGCSWRF